MQRPQSHPKGRGDKKSFKRLPFPSQTHFDWERMVSLSCGATGIAAFAVDPRILRYQMAMVSSTVGSTSFTNLEAEPRASREANSTHSLCMVNFI